LKIFFEERLNLERSLAASESTLGLCKQILDEYSVLESAIQKNSNQLKLLRAESLKAIMTTSDENLSTKEEQVSRTRLGCRARKIPPTRFQAKFWRIG